MSEVVEKPLIESTEATLDNAKLLDGKSFHELSQDEKKTLLFYAKTGRKNGFAISIDLTFDPLTPGAAPQEDLVRLNAVAKHTNFSLDPVKVFHERPEDLTALSKIIVRGNGRISVSAIE